VATRPREPCCKDPGNDRGGATYDQRRLVGRALRARVRRSAHKAWRPPVDRPDPVDLLEENNRPRLPDLVPVRYGRMLASRFAFLRGSAVIMASDLASTPVTGLRVQACGDAHLGNFGVFGTPERNLIFDVNDFDETLPGPWEWDVKRLAVSVIVAAGNLRLEAERAAGIAEATVRAYHERMAELARVAPLDAWYDRIDVATVLAIARQRRARELERQLSEARLRQRTSLRVLPKLTSVVNGTRKIIDDPPLIGHFDPEAFNGEKLIEAYAASLPPDRQRHVPRLDQLPRPRLLRAAVPRHEGLGQPGCDHAGRPRELRRGVRPDAGPGARAVRRRCRDRGLRRRRDPVRRVHHGVRTGLRRAGPARLRRPGRGGQLRPGHRGHRVTRQLRLRRCARC
jgi:hypothetical protein